jgi:hypothetical protein
MQRSQYRSAIAVTSVCAVYLLAANLLLNGPVANDLANRQPTKFVASWNTAWTLYPGHFSARGVKLAGHVRHMVGSVQADAVRGRAALLPLFTKVLRGRQSAWRRAATPLDPRRQNW